MGAIHFEHEPVLLAESTAFLDPARGGTFVDCTLGLGGHALHLLSRFPAVDLLGIDRDPEALELARERLARFGDRARLVHGEFARLDEILDRQGLRTVAGIFADLGVSSLQLEKAGRGFSLKREGRLDMRMGSAGEDAGGHGEQRGGQLTAWDVVNTYPEERLVEILRRYGEERQARRIARALIRQRSQAAIETTYQLRDIIHRAKAGGRRGPHKHGRSVDAATKVFQALRIEVNQELTQLEHLLRRAIERLEVDGRLVLISYHSLEDRIVKNILREAERGDVDPVTGKSRAETQVLEVLTRKPVRPGDEEVARNPRSRSARLRAARRL